MRAAIERQQAQSEILIGWVQFVLVAFFGILYTAAPKTSAGTGFQTVPWALGLYLLFTVLRLFLAYRRLLPRWLLLASVIVDVALLMVLIWSFHLQYEQPPAFYLKAPALLYVFIFIALRALRFEATYVLVAGSAAAVGWLCLLGYALGQHADPMGVITRDYVLYVTSNMVLVGAEIDKVISILLVTAILAVAIVRARRLLIRSVSDGMAARGLSRFVAPELANRITHAEREVRPGDGEVKVATVLFTDIEGFSTISERLSPHDLVRMLNEYFGAVAPVVERHGGVISQFQGDAMLISFNATQPDPDHAANAVRTAIGLQAVSAEHRFRGGLRLRTRCGINTGDIVSGAVGSDDRLLYTVHGDDVNVAARLEQLNKQHGTYVLLSQRTKEMAGEGFRFRRIGTITVRGREQPTEVYTVDAATGAAAA
ncbi:MAG: adenylate/guanylate cyclase domain-containing protein [Acetobacterales bacterium]